VLTRATKKAEKATGGLKKRIRDRMRSVNKKVMAIAQFRHLRLQPKSSHESKTALVRKKLRVTRVDLIGGRNTS